MTIASSGKVSKADSGQRFPGLLVALALGAGQETAEITISINSDDGLYEPGPNETFTVTLSNPADADLGEDFVTTVEIEDSDTVPLLEFDPTSVTVDEKDGMVTLTVIRSGAVNAVNVDYASNDGSATTATFTKGVSADNGNSFSEIFAVGETITIPVSFNPEPDEVCIAAEIFVISSANNPPNDPVFCQLSPTGLIDFDDTMGIADLVPFSDIVLEVADNN